MCCLPSWIIRCFLFIALLAVFDFKRSNVLVRCLKPFNRRVALPLCVLVLVWNSNLIEGIFISFRQCCRFSCFLRFQSFSTRGRLVPLQWAIIKVIKRVKADRWLKRMHRCYLGTNFVIYEFLCHFSVFSCDMAVILKTRWTCFWLFYEIQSLFQELSNVSRQDSTF